MVECWFHKPNTTDHNRYLLPPFKWEFRLIAGHCFYKANTLERNQQLLPNRFWDLSSMIEHIVNTNKTTV